MYKTNLSKLLFLGSLLLLLSSVQAQPVHSTGESTASAHAAHSMKGQHRFTFELSHTHISQGKDVTGDTKWLAMPSLGLKYDYWVSNKWAVGLQNDIITETFVVEEHLGEGKELERSQPIAVIAAGMFKPTKHSTFSLGVGGEFAKEKNLFVSRLAYEWGAHVHEHWEVGGSLAYDFRWNAYDSWTVGFGISYLVGGKKKTSQQHHN